ncbi:putative deacetylvindoline O-acetyltransferase [Helianthus annuus]|nr:putative deacetylvindoline O-acetyltransferase [Helianthus annuus]KAJ0851034.1 putative deacetylvindoline O-acetyltransferase [Helianthus annuus]
MEMIGKPIQSFTIISRDTIKPANPTPSHLQTYNLSEHDLLIGKLYSPMLLLYPNKDSCSLTAQDKTRVLKNSLSRSLTKYYPFAGRLSTHKTPFVDCNDKGVVFLEAQSEAKLEEFQLGMAQDENLDNLFADDMVWNNSPHSTNLVGIQVNHFACGGVGLAVSMSHLLGDGCTLGSFVNHWASVARYGSADHKEVLPLNPHFIHVPRTDSSEAPVMNQQNAGLSTPVTRKFFFPNSKLNDLKKLVTSATNDIPTRVEVLTSLLYKTAVAAATTNSGCFKPSYLMIPANIRTRLPEKLPQTAVGNFVSRMMVPTTHASETSLSMLVREIKKQKSQLEGVKSMQQSTENYKLLMSKLENDDQDLKTLIKRTYTCNILCGFPFNKVDFGWGKPMATGIATRSAGQNSLVLIDSAYGDGIEAHVTLEIQDMEVFQNDKELLSFCQIN